MGRVKQPRTEINPELLQKKLDEIPRGKGILSSAFKIVSPIRPYLEYINPYLDPVFLDPGKAQIFSCLIIKLREFAFSCENPDFKTGSRKEIENAYNALKKDIKEINFFLKELVPKEAKHNREAQFLRHCRRMPDFVVYLIDTYVLKLRGYLPIKVRGKEYQKKT